MIRNKVVTNGTFQKVSANLSLGEYFLESIIESIDRKGDAVALVDGNTGDQLMYSQLLQDVVNIAVGLKQLGVKRGDVVAFFGESRNEIMSGLMGAISCGAIVTMFSLLYTKDELEHTLNLSKPRVIFCSKAALDKHINVLKATKSLEHIVQINGDQTESGVISFNEVKCESDPRDYEPEAVCGATDTAFIIYTSGTTGLSKGVMLTHLNILYVCATFDSGYSVEETRRILTVLPWYHVFGLITTVQYLMHHKQIIYLSGFNPEKYLNTIQEYKVHFLLMVPPIIIFLAKSPLLKKYDVSSVKCALSGAAPLSQETADELIKQFPNFAKLVQGYGMTESTLAVLKEIDELGAKPGLLPVPGCKLKVVDLVTGEKLGPNENGEICVKSPSVMKGYLDNEAATEATFDEEGYLKTGDIGYYDENGYFSIVDRLKEIIRYKGHQVAPAVIESVILQHSDVADCGVVGKPDETAFELPTAFVVLKPGVRLTEEELLEYTYAKLSPLARLRGGVIFVDEIPKSPAGKILRRLLKQRFQDQKQ